MSENGGLPVDAEFALLLTHDVDRPYKSVQGLYHAVERRDPRQLKSLLPGVNPWWQFDDITQLEDSLGVRSAFYFLREKHVFERDLSDWLDPFYWVEHAGRYDVETPEMRDLLARLDEGGWEVGLHGSYDSYDDLDRLQFEKARLEAALGDEVVGVRQHHLNRGPDTWAHHREIGLNYDASPGSSSEYGFDRGYRPLRPFDDEFVVFPLTLMEAALPDPGEAFDRAWGVCADLLDEAADNDAVMSVLWHPRLFTEADFPGYRELYRLLVERALEMGAWVGPPGDYYDLLDHPDGSRTDDRPGVGDGPPPEIEGRLADGSGQESLTRPQAEDNKVQTGANGEPTG
ncbi:polysaccharide deacetylase family protein [Halorussus salilacus]|uniref:polysaccharide deacetylase family protein n=1 Tax=Halorussus salilacus TaxID=2953750 RepID=UPI00209FEA35|nr:polysaccharide deacetylase family protein [Halorussus salilacus]USZ68100.1 polysaccharide deacetylase family protein [Halorussus salilacus]